MKMREFFQLKPIKYDHVCVACKKVEKTEFQTLAPHDWSEVKVEIRKKGGNPDLKATVKFCPGCTEEVLDRIEEVIMTFVKEERFDLTEVKS
jgi:hypothetical protein